MSTPTLVLLAATTLSACVVLGGRLYETLAVDPFWPGRPGLVQARNGGIARRRFWLPAHLVVEVLLIAALIAAWSAPAARTALLVAAGSHVVMRVWSLLDLEPKTVTFERTDRADVDEAAALAWTRRSLLRVPLDFVTCVALFIALMFG